MDAFSNKVYGFSMILLFPCVGAYFIVVRNEKDHFAILISLVLLLRLFNRIA